MAQLKDLIVNGASRFIGNICGDVIPATDNTQFLGDSTHRWKFVGALTGNADTATKLATARTINGTSFDGSANITTANWGTARNIYIADSDGTNTGAAVSVNGSANATLKLPATIKATLTGNASSATEFSSNATVTLTGDTTGTSAGSKKSWTVATTTKYITTLGRQASADLYMGDAANKSRLSTMLASSSMTTNKPPAGDGYILNFGWDSAAGWGAQFYLQHTMTPHAMIRGAKGESNASVWGDWLYLVQSPTAGVGSTVRPAYINTSGEAKATEYMFPIYYSNLDFTSTAPNPGAYPVNGQTNPVTSTTEYGSVLSLPGIANGTKYYASQMLISSATGQAAETHAYIRRLTSTPSWSDWSTLLDNRNFDDYTVKKNGNGTKWGVAYYSDSNTVTSTAQGTAGYPLIGAGAAAPTWYGGQVNTGTAAASWVTSFNGTTNSTSTTTGAVKIAGGLGVDKDIYTARAYATTGMYPSQDNSCVMGSSTLRWKDVYGVNGVFNYLTVNATAQTTYRARIEGTAYITGVTTHGGNVVSDTNNTDSIGVTATRWKDGFFTNTLNVGTASTTSTSTTAGSTTVAVGLVTVNRATTGSVFTINGHGTSYGSLSIATFGTAAVSDGAETPTYTNTPGEVVLTLGNSKQGTSGNSGSVADNARGRLRLYGTGTKYTDLIPAQTNTNGSYTQWLPAASGNVLVNTNTTPIATMGGWTPANWNVYGGYLPIMYPSGAVYSSDVARHKVRLYAAASSNGYAGIELGNNIAQGTAGNCYGYITLWTTGTGSTSISGQHGALGGTDRNYLNMGYAKATQLWGAVWNDYAEFRETKDTIEPGRCIKENGDDTLALTTKRLERGCEIVSDTYGFAIGETEECKTPIASSGRVLAYPYESREEFAKHIGWPVCSGPNGTVSIMTEEEEEKYPSRIIGTISAVPDYEEWGTGKVQVNGRVWIRIR